MIMVNMRKMNDLVNQAIQCNQLGSPIIFIDSCTTHGIYLHRNKSQVSRKQNRFQAEKQPNKQNESFETVLINYSRLFTNCFVWVPGWIVGLIWDCWRFIKGFFVIIWWMWDSWECLKSSRDGRGFLRLLDEFPAISWDSWGILSDRLQSSRDFRKTRWNS